MAAKRTEPKGYIGRAMKRVEDPRLIKGIATYVDEITLSGVLPGHDRRGGKNMRLVGPEVGGGFGSKLNLYAEEALASHLAQRRGAPVKWIESRRENASSTIDGRDQVGEYEVAGKKDGTLLAIRSRTLADIALAADKAADGVETLNDIHASAEFCAHLTRVHAQRALELAASRA